MFSGKKYKYTYAIPSYVRMSFSEDNPSSWSKMVGALLGWKPEFYGKEEESVRDTLHRTFHLPTKDTFERKNVENHTFFQF